MLLAQVLGDVKVGRLADLRTPQGDQQDHSCPHHALTLLLLPVSTTDMCGESRRLRYIQSTGLFK